MSTNPDIIEAIAQRTVELMRKERRPPDPLPPRLLSVAQAAHYLGRTPAAVRILINKGKLRPVRMDDRVFLDREDLDREIDAAKG